MKKIFLFPCLLVTSVVVGQKPGGKLKFEQGQVLEVTLKLKSTIAQQAMGQAIDFTVDAMGLHSFKVTNATDENSTLNHQMTAVSFTFDGMGQKRNFDSRQEKDMNGPFGKPIKEMLEKKYDMIIDSSGNTLLALPEKIELSAGDSRMAIITNMLQDVFELCQPPKKGAASFFKVLPEGGAGKAEPWTESYSNEKGKFEAAYSVSDITDSTIVVDFAASSVTVSKAEMMGSETTTTMNNKSTGKIIIDRASGIIREKIINTESNGNTETSFGALPVTSKSTITITVRPIGGSGQ